MKQGGFALRPWNSILALFIFFLFGNSIADARSLRVAILDNFHYQKFVTSRYKEFYMKGIELAVHDARKQGIDVEYKIFQYEPDAKERLSIRKQIPLVKKWSPDVIIGPRDSNNFLLLSSVLKNTLVVSPFATSSAVASMPDNFYSMTLPVKYSAQIMFDLVRKQYRERSALVIADIECKSCDDVSHQFVKIWRQGSHQPISLRHILSDDASTTPILSLLKGYEKNSVILLPNNAHETSVLMLRISHVIPDAIFIGGDGWGSWKDTEVGHYSTDKDYVAYHVEPWNIEICTDRIKNFSESYFNFYRQLPSDKLAYLSYEALMSITTAVKQNLGKDDNVSPQSILSAYKEALKKNPNWFRSKSYVVERIYKGKNLVFAIGDPFTNKLSYTKGGQSKFKRCEVGSG